MSVYAIGDVQGCFDDLMHLLDGLQFNEKQDTLWFVGDLINRGPKSLETLEFIAGLPSKVCVLGNHDIHLLAVHYGARTIQPKDTIAPILDSPNRDFLIDFLRQQPLFHFDETLGYAMVHAGIHPSWSFEQAKGYSDLISAELCSDHVGEFLKQAFGNHPDYFDDTLTGADKLRAIINIFTRMRVLTPDEHLVLNYKGTYDNRPEGTEAWFNVRSWHESEKLIFGHWAALMGQTSYDNLFAIDTGCVWGNHLTAIKVS